MEIARHQVSEQLIARAVDDIQGRVATRHHRLRWDDLTLKGLRDTRDEILDHVAARTLSDPALSATEAHLALRTAASCSAGVLDLSLWPEGDFYIEFPLITDYLDLIDGNTNDRERFNAPEAINTVNLTFAGEARRIPSVSEWSDAFALCLLGSEFRHPWRYHLILRGEVASEIRSEATDPAAVAEMDALCAYVDRTMRRLDGPDPMERLRKPDADERARAARRLDDAGPLTPDQRLLRVLLDDDRPAFDRALADRLTEYRDTVGDDPAPRSLLPLATIVLAKLAVLVHGWDLDVRSGYLPEALLRLPAPADPAVSSTP
ncbi:immunity 49 family protein [Actinomadura algeriensis]|uniref:Immunity protein 49 of polymorphic toxin system n=1 Tax=Actinomadura algeriensis TaxID=1679523 RepID=A0ABR9JRC4_9ACTN|nr:immunity 49 family protein [Actinomadura algeriensis]MBE1533119.1 hypothetical protein [Actinomadura algeriensis]